MFILSLAAVVARVTLLYFGYGEDAIFVLGVFKRLAVVGPSDLGFRETAYFARYFDIIGFFHI